MKKSQPMTAPSPEIQEIVRILNIPTAGLQGFTLRVQRGEPVLLEVRSVPQQVWPAPSPAGSYGDI